MADRTGGKVLALGALLMVGLGQLLQGMVVTFPYSGVLVVVETRRDLVEFRAHFARNSLALLAFFTAYTSPRASPAPSPPRQAGPRSYAAHCCCT